MVQDITNNQPKKKFRRMTYNELEKWLTQCKGLIKVNNKVYNNIYFDCENRNKEVRNGIEICGYNEKLGMNH